MTNPRQDSDKQRSRQAGELNSSTGTHSPSVTAKDAAPQDAAARDMQERNLTSTDLEEKAQALLDEAIDQTFPASDPIAVPTFEEALETVKAQQAREEAERRAQTRH